jgi:hypothetical protein
MEMLSNQLFFRVTRHFDMGYLDDKHIYLTHTEVTD